MLLCKNVADFTANLLRINFFEVIEVSKYEVKLKDNLDSIFQNFVYFGTN